MEDLAYRRMLDAYYLRECALPADPAEVARLIRMRQNVADVEAVLREFFQPDEGGWRHARCDEEIGRMREKQTSNEERGKHERERMQRHRERRAELFDALRGVGVVPAWDVGIKELQRLHSEHCNATETGLKREQAVSGNEPATAIPTPTPTPTPYSVPYGTDGEAVKSADQLTKDELWTAGKSLLHADGKGLPLRQCGSFVGKLVKDYGDQIVIDAVRSAVVARPADPVEYLKACCMRANGQRMPVNRQEALEQRNRNVADEWAAQGDSYAAE